MSDQPATARCPNCRTQMSGTESATPSERGLVARCTQCQAEVEVPEGWKNKQRQWHELSEGKQGELQIAGTLFAVAAAVAVVGVLLPWIVVESGFGGTTSVGGTSVRLFDEWFGNAWAWVGVGVFGCVYAAQQILIQELPFDADERWYLLVGSFFCVPALWAAIRLNTITRDILFVRGSVSAGIGLWSVLLAGVIAFVAAVMTVRATR